MRRPPPCSTLFPYTTLFRSIVVDPRGAVYVGFWEVGGSSGGVAQSLDGGKTFTILPGIEGQSVRGLAIAPSNPEMLVAGTDRKSTRLNSSHSQISYAVFCLK